MTFASPPNFPPLPLLPGLYSRNLAVFGEASILQWQPSSQTCANAARARFSSTPSLKILGAEDGENRHLLQLPINVFILYNYLFRVKRHFAQSRTLGW